jgi:hypothetical protein
MDSLSVGITTSKLGAVVLDQLSSVVNHSDQRLFGGLIPAVNRVIDFVRNR